MWVMARRAFVPERLSQNLITFSTVLRDILCFVVLLNAAIMVLGVPAETGEGSGPHLVLNSFDIDTGHWVEGGRDAPAGQGRAFVCRSCGSSAGY
jgi:hypothetical protein